MMSMNTVYRYVSGRAPRKLRAETASFAAYYRWTVQGSLMASVRLGPVHADVLASADIANEHNGYEVALKLAWPLDGGRHILVPELEFNYQSDDFVNHYYGVRAEKALRGRRALFRRCGLPLLSTGHRLGRRLIPWRLPLRIPRPVRLAEPAVLAEELREERIQQTAMRVDLPAYVAKQFESPAVYLGGVLGTQAA